MIISFAVVVWAILIFAGGLGYYYGRNQIDPDTLEGLYYYRSK